MKESQTMASGRLHSSAWGKWLFLLLAFLVALLVAYLSISAITSPTPPRTNLWEKGPYDGDW